MPTEWISFDDALGRTEDRHRHLLLGNGFSMSVHAGFGYKTLYDEARRADRGLAALFRGHEPDFEKALAAVEAPEEAARIRAAFISAVTRVHPRIKYLDPGAREVCGRFLELFAGRRSRADRSGSVFTTNYDLMLYWVLMANHDRLNLYDGFDNYGLWDEARIRKSTLFYLHGALHHYERPFGYVRPKMEQRKLLWREGASLIVQIRDNVARGAFPVFVSEGDPESKARRIRRNRYLRKVAEHLAQTCAEPDTAIFTVGHSLGSVDAHITDSIGAGAADVYLGVYRPQDDGSRAEAVAKQWAERREIDTGAPLRVALFDSSECHIWKPS